MTTTTATTTLTAMTRPGTHPAASDGVGYTRRGRASVRRVVAAAALAAVVLPGLAACNVPFVRGGGTSCKDFLNASSGDQRTIAGKAFPNAGVLQDPRSEVGFYCATHVGGNVSDIAP